MLTNPFKDLRKLGRTISDALIKGLNSHQGAGGFIFLWPNVSQFKDTVPLKGQRDIFSFGRMPSNSKKQYLSRGKRIYFPLAMYPQIQRHPESEAMTHSIW